MELTDGLRQRDQVLRKFESEMESVQFRNQQLSKRVEILQVKLSTFPNKSRILYLFGVIIFIHNVP